MKKIIYSLFTLVVLFSCSKNNDEPKNPDNYLYPTDFEITYKLSGDTDKVDIFFYMIGDGLHRFTQVGSSKQLGVSINLDEYKKSGKITYKIKPSSILMINYSYKLDDDYINDPNVNATFTIQVKREGKEIHNETYTINKDNPKEGLYQFSFTKKTP